MFKWWIGFSVSWHEEKSLRLKVLIDSGCASQYDIECYLDSLRMAKSLRGML